MIHLCFDTETTWIEGCQELTEADIEKLCIFEYLFSNVPELASLSNERLTEISDGLYNRLHVADE